MDSLFKNFWYKKPVDVNQVTDSFGGYRPSQPSQKYPFIPTRAPRVDNQNQPWYGGNRWWARGPDDIQSVDAVAKETSSSKDRYMLFDGWKFLNDWFGGATAKYELKDKTNVYGMMNRYGNDNMGGRGRFGGEE